MNWRLWLGLSLPLVLATSAYAADYRYVGAKSTSDCVSRQEATFTVHQLPVQGEGTTECGYFCHVLVWTGLFPTGVTPYPDYSEAGCGFYGRKHSNNARCQLFWTNKRKGSAQWLKSYIPNGTPVRIVVTKVPGKKSVVAEWFWAKDGTNYYKRKTIGLSGWTGDDLGVHPTWAPEVAGEDVDTNYPEGIDVQAANVTIQSCDTVAFLQQQSPLAAIPGSTITNWRTVHPAP